MTSVRRPSGSRLIDSAGRIISTGAQSIVNFGHCPNRKGGGNEIQNSGSRGFRRRRPAFSFPTCLRVQQASIGAELASLQVVALLTPAIHGRQNTGTRPRRLPSTRGPCPYGGQDWLTYRHVNPGPRKDTNYSL